MREEFEAWVRRDWPAAPLHYVRDALPKSDPRYGQYCDDRLQHCWVGWQASRAALKVELPPALHAGDLFEDTPVYSVSMVKVILQQSGIEVK